MTVTGPPPTSRRRIPVDPPGSELYLAATSDAASANSQSPDATPSSITRRRIKNTTSSFTQMSVQPPPTPPVPALGAPVEEIINFLEFVASQYVCKAPAVPRGGDPIANVASGNSNTSSTMTRPELTKYSRTPEELPPEQFSKPFRSDQLVVPSLVGFVSPKTETDRPPPLIKQPTVKTVKLYPSWESSPRGEQNNIALGLIATILQDHTVDDTGEPPTIETGATATPTCHEKMHIPSCDYHSTIRETVSQ